LEAERRSDKVLLMRGRAIVITFIIGFLAVVYSGFSANVFAEDKNAPAGIIPKLAKTPEDPILENGGVYPMWGPVCQRYTYHTTYRDKEGRAPEYVRLYFNGQWLDVSPENPNDQDYKKGVKYAYKYVPNKLGSNFFFFEASNGKGKTREGIIDSPGNGPVLFEGDFKDNEIALIDGGTGQKLWSYPTESAWVSGVALSDDGKYLAALTVGNIYFFDTSSSKPLWIFSTGMDMDTPGDVKGGIDISGDGSKIFASVGNQVYLFDKSSNRPLWMATTGNNGAYSVAISKDGAYMAAGTAGNEDDQNSNLVILWNAKSGKSLWQYHASGNFHEVSLANDGKFIAGATGCPDRRAYIFSRDSNQPILRSEMLTRDSPVDEAQISGDGSLAAFGLESDRGGLVVFKNGDKEPIWKIDTPDHKSIRALAVSDSGKLIGAGTFGGDVYVFDSNSSQPGLAWKVNASVGAVEISDQGEVLAAGGADSKVHLYKAEDKNFHKEVSLGEYVGEIDVSGNGKYVAAGTSGSTYFFETFSPNEGKTFSCTTVLEPSPMGKMGSMEGTAKQTNSSKPATAQISKKMPGMLFGLGGGLSLLVLVFYVAVLRLPYFQRIKAAGVKLNNAKFISRLKLNTKKVMIILSVTTGVLLLLTAVSMIFNKLTFAVATPAEDVKTEQGEQNRAPGKQGDSVCGNTMCEPNFGETRGNCPGDCTE